MNLLTMKSMKRIVVSGVLLLSGFLPASGAVEETVGTLAKGTRSISFGGGVAVGTKIWGGALRHDAAMANLRYGMIVSDLLAEESVFRGRFELAGSFTYAQHYKPNSSYLFDAASQIRYIFDSSEKWKPFADIGIGFVYTDIGEPDLGGKFQFSPQGGIGVHRFFGPNFALTFQQRYVHYSNGGIRSPNGGINQFVSLLSLTRFY